MCVHGTYIDCTNSKKRQKRRVKIKAREIESVIIVSFNWHVWQNIAWNTIRWCMELILSVLVFVEKHIVRKNRLITHVYRTYFKT